MCRCICGRGESTERSCCTWEHSFPLHSGVPGPTGHYVESKETEAARPEARAGVMAGVRCWAVARRPCSAARHAAAARGLAAPGARLRLVSSRGPALLVQRARVGGAVRCDHPHDTGSRATRCTDRSRIHTAVLVYDTETTLHT